MDWELHAEGIAMRERRHYLLEPTSLNVGTGEVVVAAGDPGHGHTVLALALAGRFRGHDGTVLINGSAQESELQRRVALVDVPGVSEPDPSLPISVIIGEELAIAGHKANKDAVHGLLTDLDLADLAHARVEDVDAGPRLAIGARLAASRPDVRFLVAVLPERNGGLADTWLPMLHHLAGTGVGIIVTASIGLAPHLGVAPGKVFNFGNAREDVKA